MVKDITTSQLDFLSLEEVSDQAAETISGGIGVEFEWNPLPTGTLSAEAADILEPLQLPQEAMESMAGLTETLGLGGFLPELPEFGGFGGFGGGEGGFPGLPTLGG